MSSSDTPTPSASGASTKISAARVTDVGMVREHNEDSSHADTEQRFFIVADGMGGHAFGEVASAMTVEQVTKSLTEAKAQVDAFAASPTDEGRKGIVQLMQNSVLAAHQSVYGRAMTEPDKQGMGTTLDVVLIAGAEAFVAHVGDSRTYLIRDKQCAQLTTDHTVAEVWLLEGKITPEEAAVSNMRNVLVNAIGVSPEIGVEMAHLQLRKDDRLLICSDGLHDYFPEDEEFAAELSQPDITPSLQKLVDEAKNRGGHDNITGIVVNIDAIDRQATELEREATAPVELAPDMPKSKRSRQSDVRATRPLRAVKQDLKPTASGAKGRELGTADTIPPDARLRRNEDGSLTKSDDGGGEST